MDYNRVWQMTGCHTKMNSKTEMYRKIRVALFRSICGLNRMACRKLGMAIPEWRWLVFLCLLRVRCEVGELIQADTRPSPFALTQTYQSPDRDLTTTYQPPTPGATSLHCV